MDERLNGNEQKPGVIVKVEEATINTATIRIRMLTIDRRKVTLSLFRQLKQKEVIDPDSGELMGKPWGTVNYFWSDCDGNYDPEDVNRRGRHLHVIWSDDDELYRDCCYPRGHSAAYGRDAARRFRHLAALLAWSVVYGGPDLLTMMPDGEQQYAIRRRHEQRCWFLSREFDYQTYNKLYLFRTYEWYPYKPAFSDKREFDPEAQRKADGKAVESLKVRCGELEQTYTANYRMLEAMGQLYIAG